MRFTDFSRFIFQNDQLEKTFFFKFSTFFAVIKFEKYHFIRYERNGKQNERFRFYETDRIDSSRPSRT